MYYIYIVTLKEKEVYIGCTNNISRRKDQHNENIKKKHGRFATYIADNYPNFSLKKEDFKIKAIFESRRDALVYEKKLTKSFIGKAKVLNDNYNIDCSRKNKNLGNTSKKYVFIDIMEHTSELVVDLRQFCIKKELDYKLIQRTVKGDLLSYKRYKVFYECDWEDLENKEYYLSGDFYEDKKKRKENDLIKRSSKKYIVKTPEGEEIEVLNLDKFAREHNLTSGTLHATYTKNKPTKGYQVIKRI